MSELIRYQGWLRLPIAYCQSRFVMRPGNPVWMPQRQCDLACQREELSARCREMLTPVQQKLTAAGFTLVQHNKLTHHLSPMFRDSGAILAVHANRAYVATSIYTKHYHTRPVVHEKEWILLTLSAVYPNGSFTVYNNKSYFNPPSGSIARYILTEDFDVIYPFFLRLVQQQKETPLTFSDNDALLQRVDARHMRQFERHVARGLYVRMTDEEVEQARAKLNSW